MINYILLLVGAIMLGIALNQTTNTKRNGVTDLMTVLIYLLAGTLLLAALINSIPDSVPTALLVPDDSAPAVTVTTAESTTIPRETTPATQPTTPPVTTAPPETTAPTQPSTPAGSDKTLQPGWNDIDGKRYYGNDDGTAHTGWLKLSGESYYFYEDGTMAKGEVNIDGTNYHFTSTGKRIIMVNPWNPVPKDYVLDLQKLGVAYATDGNKVQSSCAAALKEMINACNSACPGVCVVSAYRSIDAQTRNFERRVQTFIGQGYSEEEARRKTAQIIAVPGTSEHHLGLAVDIVDTRLWALEEEQADLPAQQWLMKNCWKYGFILRYPKDKTHITGIIYEPWHYRYVGKELAQEIHELGDITLEEYIQNLTEK